MCVWVVGFNFAIECKCLIVGIVICKQKNVRHAERITVHGIFFLVFGFVDCENSDWNSPFEFRWYDLLHGWDAIFVRNRTVCSVYRRSVREMWNLLAMHKTLPSISVLIALSTVWLSLILVLSWNCHQAFHEYFFSYSNSDVLHVIQPNKN